MTPQAWGIVGLIIAFFVAWFVIWVKPASLASWIFTIFFATVAAFSTHEMSGEDPYERLFTLVLLVATIVIVHIFAGIYHRRWKL